MILRNRIAMLQVGLALGGCLTMLGNVFAQSEAVFIKRAATLRDAPGEASRSIASLPPQAAVTRLSERQGAWVKVSTLDGAQGWVHMFDIAASTAGNGSNAQPGNAGTAALRGITGFFNKSGANANAGMLTTSTVGIRGLGAEDLARAQPDPAALAAADAARVGEYEALQFAAAASLKPREVNALVAPTAPSTSFSSPSGSRTGNAADEWIHGR